jgi:hypothetical protein
MARMGEDELRGGRWADVSALAEVLAHQGLPVSEALLFAASGGIGAGYSLRDFTPDALTLGFRSRWQDPQAWIKSTVDRLGLDAAVHTSGSKRTAAKRFQAEIAEGPVLVLNERGQFAVAHTEQEVPDKRLLVAIRPGKIEDLPGAVRAGLADCAKQLRGAPEWARWAKAMTDGRDSRGWPRVFAERRWLVGTLLTVWERVSAGGHLRGLFAEALKEASDLLELPTLGEQAEVWRGIGEQWDELAEAALLVDLGATPPCERSSPPTSWTPESRPTRCTPGCASAACSCSCRR